MSLRDKLRKIEGVKSILFKDSHNQFEKEVKKKDFSKIKPPFELVLRVFKDGKRKHITLPFKNRTFKTALKEAELELNRIKIEGFGKQIKIPNYEQLLEEFLKQKEKSMSLDNIKRYKSIMNNHLGHIKRKRIDKIKPEHIQHAVNKALENGRAPRTAKAVQDYTRPVFNYAIGKGYIEKNPANDLKIPKFDNKRYFQIDETTAKKLYKAILEYENPLYRGIFIWLLHGRRLNEVLSLEWQHINFKTGTYEIVYQNNKARRNKIYPLTQLQIDALPKPHQSFGIVFKGKNGNKIDRSSFSQRHWTKIKQRAGIVGMRLHDLRHLFGYLAVNVLHLPLEAIAEVLGHTSTQVTARYANVSLDTVKSATDKFFELLKEESNGKTY